MQHPWRGCILRLGGVWSWPRQRRKPSATRAAAAPTPIFRHQASLPAPALERLLTTLLAPLAYQRWQQRQGLRERVLTLPALAAVVVAVWRGLGSAHQAARTLALAGLLWEPAQRLSRQALTHRWAVFPAAQFAALLDDVIAALRVRSPASPAPPGFACCWLADVSTLEELRRRTEAMPARPAVTLGGRPARTAASGVGCW